MQLAKSTDLALRVVLHLGRTTDAASLTGGQLASAVGGPFPQVAEAVGTLQRLGVLTGWADNTGLSLTERGRTASVGWLVRELEGAGEVVGCTDDPPCPLVAAGCRLRKVLRTAQEAFFAALDPVIVQDLLVGETRWLDLTGPPAR